jgi:cell division protein FtsW
VNDVAAYPVRRRWTMSVEARLLILVTAVLVAIGLATVYSASAIVAEQSGRGHAHFVINQFYGVLAGIVVFLFARRFDADRWARLAWPLMIVTLVLLTIVILPWTESIAPRINGSRRFLMGGSVQPSELGKLALIIWTAMLLVKKGDQMRRLTRGLLPFLVILGVMCLLVYLEPDLSVVMMYTLMFGVMLFAAGVRIGHFVALGIVSVPLIWNRMQEMNYVLLRMTSFFDPGAAPQHIDYQLRQSLIAIGSGGPFGVGLGQGRQQYGFLPYAYDDFIVSTIGEEWGFLGMMVIILAFALYAWLGLRIARQARSPFLRIVAFGITFTVVVTAYLHIGVAIGLLPTTGLTLPFVSYGRSNLLLSILMTGILVNIGSTREKVINEGATDPLELSTA